MSPRLLLGLALCAPLLACARGPAHAAPPRAVVLVLCDSLRADRLSPDDEESPVDAGLAQLVARATRFERAFAPAPWAAPSTASALTGLDPDRHGLLGGRGTLREDVATLGDLLGARGFETAAFTAGGGLDPARGAARGYEDVRLLSSSAGRPPGADQLVGAATEWLDRVRGRPFALHVHLRDAAHPYGVPREWAHAVPAAAGLDPDSDEARRREHERGVRFALDRVGELIEALDRRGLYDDALVVLAGTSGEALGEEPGVFGTGHDLGPELLRVPLLVKLPRQREARVSDAPVSLTDVLPTVCAALGLPAPQGLDGRSLVPLALGGAAPGPRTLFATVQRQRHCVGDAVLDWPHLLVVTEGTEGREDARLLDLGADAADRLRDRLRDRPREAARLLDALAARRARGPAAPRPDPRDNLHPEILEALRSF